jgi:hypothetical protein
MGIEGERLGVNLQEAVDDITKYCEAVTQNYQALKERIPLMEQEPTTAVRLNPAESRQTEK